MQHHRNSFGAPRYPARSKWQDERMRCGYTDERFEDASGTDWGWQTGPSERNQGTSSVASALAAAFPDHLLPQPPLPASASSVSSAPSYFHLEIEAELSRTLHTSPAALETLQSAYSLDVGPIYRVFLGSVQKIAQVVGSYDAGRSFAHPSAYELQMLAWLETALTGRCSGVGQEDKLRLLYGAWRFAVVELDSKVPGASMARAVSLVLLGELLETVKARSGSTQPSSAGEAPRPPPSSSAFPSFPNCPVATAAAPSAPPPPVPLNTRPPAPVPPTSSSQPHPSFAQPLRRPTQAGASGPTSVSRPSAYFRKAEQEEEEVDVWEEELRRRELARRTGHGEDSASSNEEEVEDEEEREFGEKEPAGWYLTPQTSPPSIEHLSLDRQPPVLSSTLTASNPLLQAFTSDALNPGSRTSPSPSTTSSESTDEEAETERLRAELAMKFARRKYIAGEELPPLWREMSDGQQNWQGESGKESVGQEEVVQLDSSAANRPCSPPLPAAHASSSSAFATVPPQFARPPTPTRKRYDRKNGPQWWERLTDKGMRDYKSGQSGMRKHGAAMECPDGGNYYDRYQVGASKGAGRRRAW
ncbi:hypothetical protein JCM10213_003933 [Rhodosporidiobolus nylandii]